MNGRFYEYEYYIRYWVSACIMGMPLSLLLQAHSCKDRQKQRESVRYMHATFTKKKESFFFANEKKTHTKNECRVQKWFLSAFCAALTCPFLYFFIKEINLFVIFKIGKATTTKKNKK